MQFHTIHIDEAQYAADSQQVIFINQENDTILDDFFTREYDNVVSLFSQYDYQFVFLPKLLDNGFLKELIAYNCPDLDERAALDFERNFSISEFYNKFAITDLQTYRAGLLNAKKQSSESSPFWDAQSYNFQFSVPNFKTRNEFLFADLNARSDENIWEQLENYLQYRNPERYWQLHTITLYNRSEVYESRIIIDVKEYDSDENFPEEAFRLTQEIKANVKKLRAMGVNELLIRNLFEEKRTISHLRITKDFQFFLTDYQDKEIKIGPLPKALYLLFLRHPEGILFKEISDYRNELFALYLLVANREADSDMRASILQITDPTCNSLNENCSRIRQAFLKEISDDYARNYYITGQRATPKGIQLDRNLVNYDSEVMAALAAL